MVKPLKHIEYNDYDKIILFFSGGKDSVYCYLQLLEAGIKPEKIELHHHLIDGNEGSTLMDWPITESYCRAFGKAFGSEVFMSWRIGGFEREMLREDDATEAIMFEDENHNVVYAPGGLKNPPLGTRRKFPQVTANLSQRWCSSALKIDVGDRLIKRQFRFSGDRKYLVITGERAEESAARAKYKSFETHRSFIDGKRTRRLIYHARIAKEATEVEVWDLLKKYGVNPHPAYQAGWGRTSCLTCIFGSPNQWATVAKYMPDHFNKVAAYEEEFGVTIHRTMSIVEQAEKGDPYNVEPEVYRLAMSKDYDQEIILTGGWDLPKGAFGDASGPT
jgi:3'-phosphoadenosine 5'-phosphosulfate sulfotransferase (PAPS reductase)/FAD synthetase